MGNKIIIVNKVTGKSVRMYGQASTLKHFGELISIDSLDQDNYDSDVVLQYTFNNILFKISSKGKIATFETRTNEIALEVKGEFSISIGDHIDKMSSIFPESALDSRMINRERDGKQYFLVNLSLSFYSEKNNKYMEEEYEGIALLFDPDSKILEKMTYWITP